MPSRFLSSGQKAIRLFSASLGVFIFTSRPSSFMLPLDDGTAPNNISAVSVRPLPKSPAKPTSSPSRTFSEKSSTFPGTPMCEASSAFFASGLASALSSSNICEKSFPIIIVTSSTRPSSLMSYVPTRWPLRKIVILSEIS